MVKGFVKDIQRLVEITPTQDCVDQIIHAHVYDQSSGEFVKVVNQVVVAPEQNRFEVDVVSRNVGTLHGFTITVSGRNINDDAFVEVYQDTFTTDELNTNISGLIDSQGFRDFRIEVDAENELSVVRSLLEVVDRDFDPEGVVVGGPARVPIVVPCDFRGIDPGDCYSIVFFAENVGVIARDILLLFGDDGFEIYSGDES